VLDRIAMDYPDLQRFDVYAAGTAEQLQIARDLFLRHGLPGQHWHSSSP
jgi:CDP-4-dehydro-6-deoxyglucose reductase